MSLLQQLDDQPGYAKAGVYGPQGSGKTLTGTLLAIEIWRHFGSTKPIAFYDTEGGSDFMRPLIIEATGMVPLRHKSRAFTELLEVGRECVAGAADVLIVDSITHVWRELNEARLAVINEARKERGAKPIERLDDISDIMFLKEVWSSWSDLFTSSPIHIIVCGREGNEWGAEVNEETGKRSSVAVGKKMKVEAEFGFEPNLLIAMSSAQLPEVLVRQSTGADASRRPRAIEIYATVLKDRFNVINGHVFKFPTGAEFLPHLEKLVPALHRSVDTTVKSHALVSTRHQQAPAGASIPLGDSGPIVSLADVVAEVEKRFPSSPHPAVKKARERVLQGLFGVKSINQLSRLDSDSLAKGFTQLTSEDMTG